MKALRFVIILILTAMAALIICAPSLLQQYLPAEIVSAASLDDLPLLNTCGRIARQLLEVLEGDRAPAMEIVTNAIGDGFMDELIALVMVALMTIPVAAVLNILLYKPLYSGPVVKGLLYVSLHLCSVMIAWFLYRQVYYRLLIEGVIQQYINSETLQTAVNYLTQGISALLVGAVAIKILVAFMAAQVVLHKILMPIIGTLVRTLLFVFLVTEIMLLQANPDHWKMLALMMLGTAVLSGISDAIFGAWN